MLLSMPIKIAVDCEWKQAGRCCTLNVNARQNWKLRRLLSSLAEGVCRALVRSYEGLVAAGGEAMVTKLCERESLRCLTLQLICQIAVHFKSNRLPKAHQRAYWGTELDHKALLLIFSSLDPCSRSSGRIMCLSPDKQGGSLCRNGNYTKEEIETWIHDESPGFGKWKWMLRKKVLKKLEIDSWF